MREFIFMVQIYIIIIIIIIYIIIYIIIKILLDRKAETFLS